MSLSKIHRHVSISTQESVAEVFNKLEDEKCDPITELARIAMAELTPLSDKISILKELAQYTAPKRKAVDVTTSSPEGIVVTIKNFSNDPKQITSLMNPDAISNPQELLKQSNSA